MRIEIGALWTAIYFLVVALACQPDSGKRNIEAYYFPFSDLKEGNVYEYRPVRNDTLPVEYWYFRSYDLDSARIFTGNYYDQDFNVKQFFTEEIVSNGTLMKNYFLYATDSLGAVVRVPAEVLAPNVFPFEVSDSSGIFLFKLRFVSGKDPEVTTTLIRNRRYMGSASYSFKGEPYDCVAFSLRELVDVHIEGEGHSEPEYAGKELYAKGIGLIYYKKEVGEGVNLEYELADIYGMAAFEDKFKRALHEQ